MGVWFCLRLENGFDGPSACIWEHGCRMILVESDSTFAIKRVFNLMNDKDPYVHIVHVSKKLMPKALKIKSIKKNPNIFHSFISIVYLFTKERS